MTDHSTTNAAKPAALALALLAMLGVSSSLHAQQHPSVSPTAGIDAAPRTMQTLGFERTATSDSTAAGGGSGLPGSSVPMPDGRITLPRPPGGSPSPQPTPEPEVTPPPAPPPVVVAPPAGDPLAQCRAGEYSSTPLTNSTQLGNQAGTAGQSLIYSIRVPAGATNLRVLTAGGTGDVTLYVSACNVPTEQSYDEISNRPGNNETVTVPAPIATTYYIRVVGVRDFGRLTVQARFTAGSGF